MSKEPMTCPHCHKDDPLFEAVEDICFRPVVDGWEFDAPESKAAARKVAYQCLECSGKVRIDIPVRKIMKAI